MPSWSLGCGVFVRYLHLWKVGREAVTRPRGPGEARTWCCSRPAAPAWLLRGQAEQVNRRDCHPISFRSFRNGANLHHCPEMQAGFDLLSWLRGRGVMGRHHLRFLLGPPTAAGLTHRPGTRCAGRAHGQVCCSRLGTARWVCRASGQTPVSWASASTPSGTWPGPPLVAGCSSVMTLGPLGLGVASESDCPRLTLRSRQPEAARGLRPHSCPRALGGVSAAASASGDSHPAARVRGAGLTQQSAVSGGLGHSARGDELGGRGRTAGSGARWLGFEPRSLLPERTGPGV